MNYDHSNGFVILALSLFFIEFETTTKKPKCIHTSHILLRGAPYAHTHVVASQAAM